MIRTLLVISAFAAVAGAASAAETKVNLVGKDYNTIRTEVSQAAKTVCQSVDVTDYAPCVSEAYQNAMAQVIKVRLNR